MTVSRRSARLAILISLVVYAFVCLAFSVAPGARATGKDDLPRLEPKAFVETEAVPSDGDAADDPAIWVHPGDPTRSLILGTDKKGGLNVFDLEGRRLQIVSHGSRPNNV